MTAFKQTSGKLHLTATDRKIIIASIQNGNQNVQTRFKKFQVVEVNGDNVKAVLTSYEDGIGIGAPKSWVSRKVEYTITKR